MCYSICQQIAINEHVVSQMQRWRRVAPLLVLCFSISRVLDHWTSRFNFVFMQKYAFYYENVQIFINVAKLLPLIGLFKWLYSSAPGRGSSRHQLDFCGKHSATLKLLHEYYSLTFPPPSSQVLICTAESTGASMEKMKMPKLRNSSKGDSNSGY